MKMKSSYYYRLGDQIASVNDNTLLNVTHADAVKILKDSDHNIELVSMLLCVFVVVGEIFTVHFFERSFDVRMTGNGHQCLIMAPWIEDTDVSS